MYSFIKKFVRGKWILLNLIIFIILFAPEICKSQNLLNGPQKIVIDKERNRYIVSNFNGGGDLVQIDSLGNQSYFVENAGMTDGMQIVGDTVYGMGPAQSGIVRGYDLGTGLMVMNLTLTGVQHVSSFVADSSGFLYTSERFGTRIFKIDPKTQTYWVFASGNGIDEPNGILYEPEKDRLLVCIDQPNPPILAISLIDSTVSTVVNTTLGGSDGIAKDPNGNYYITGYYLPGIYKFNSGFSGEPELFFTGNYIVYPTYNEKNNSLLITYYNQNQWGEVPLPSNGTIINVPGDFNTIQEGINAAQDGDTVLVAEGEYPENINFRGKNIVVASMFIIDGDYSHILNTVIDGSMYIIIDSASCVIFVSGEDSTAVIQGFTLTGGKGTTYDLSNINPSWNQFTQEGGGIFIDQSSPTIKNNLIINNEAARLSGYDFSGGGGISSFFGNPRIYNNVIMSNSAGYACGIVLNWSGGIIKNNVVYGNYGGEIEGAGGIMIWDIASAPQIVENNTVVYNISELTAGGIVNYNTPSIIRNNIVWGNEQQSGQQITGYETATFEYCNTEESYPGLGNINVVPDFDTSNFILNTSSLCIDAGNPGVSFNDKEDSNNTGFALYPSLGGLRNDIGAYGGPGAMLMPDFEYITGIENSKNFIPQEISLGQNYPNPFNPTTTIRYQIPEFSYVTIKVYDILGNDIVTLVNEEKPAGKYKLNFDGTGLPSGIYFYRINTGNSSITKKMLLIK